MASKRYNAIRAKVDRAKAYPVQEALKLVKDGATAKFNESVDVSINLGIDATQSANSGYAVYDADAGFKDVGFGGTLTWRFWDRAAVTAIAEVKELLGDAADSPIVDQAGSSTQAFVGLALSYRFTW